MADTPKIQYLPSVRTPAPQPRFVPQPTVQVAALRVASVTLLQLSGQARVRTLAQAADDLLKLSGFKWNGQPYKR